MVISVLDGPLKQGKHCLLFLLLYIIIIILLLLLLLLFGSILLLTHNVQFWSISSNPGGSVPVSGCRCCQRQHQVKASILVISLQTHSHVAFITVMDTFGVLYECVSLARESECMAHPTSWVHQEAGPILPDEVVVSLPLLRKPLLALYVYFTSHTFTQSHHTCTAFILLTTH